MSSMCLLQPARFIITLLFTLLYPAGLDSVVEIFEALMYSKTPDAGGNRAKRRGTCAAFEGDDRLASLKLVREIRYAEDFTLIIE